MRICLLILVIFLPVAGWAQYGKPALDSLLKKLPAMRDDTNKVEVLNLISSIYSRIDAAKGIVAGKEGVMLATRLNYSPGVAGGMSSLGLCYTADAEYSKAMACLDTCYLICEKKGYKAMMVLALMNKGLAFNQQGRYPAALDYSMRSLRVAEQIGDSNHIALNLLNLGAIYSKLEDYSKTLAYERQAYAYYKHSRNKVELAMVLVSMADAYDGMGQRAKSFEAYNEGIVLLRQLGDKAGLAINLANRAITYSEDKRYELAIRDFSEAMALADSLGDSYRLASILDNFAHTYIDAAQAISVEAPDRRVFYLGEARRTLERTLPINQKNGNLDALSDNYKYLALLDSTTGNYKEALAAYKQYRFYNDSILTQNSQKAIQKLEDQRLIDVRDKQIELDRLELTNQRSQRWLFIGGLLFLFLVGTLLFFQGVQRKRSNRQLRLLNNDLDEANKSKATLFGIIGHDLRGPLGSLINYLHLKREAPHLSEEGRERYEKKIASGAQSLLYTMDELLFWGKAQMQNFSPKKERVAVRALFADMRSLYADEEGVVIRFVDQEGVQLYTDGDYLKTILRNLTTNSIKAVQGQPMGDIVWRAWQEGGSAYLSIADNGPGISEDGRRALFGQAVLNGKNGLGLHLVRNFTAAIGVRVHVEALPGGGTVIVLDMGRGLGRDYQG